MFESAELGHKISKNTFREEEPKLRAALLDAQFDLRENGKFPVVILISGVDGAGKGETINVLYEWMDPRYLSTLAFSAPTDEERERPYMWRFWRALPPKGRAGIFAGSWYSNPIAERIRGELTTGELDQRMDQINRFEAMLVNEGALVIKFWFHLSKDGQKERLKALEKDPRTAWRVTKESWDRLKTYDKLQEAAGHVLRMTNTPWAPWVVVEGTDDRYRSLTVGKIVLDALQNRQSGMFRQDLYYRIRVVGLHLPPLRARIEDIPRIFEHYLKWFLERTGREPRLTGTARDALMKYSWPGNVRQLRNVAEVVTYGDNDRIEAHHIQEALGEQESASTEIRFVAIPEEGTLKQMESAIVRGLLAKHSPDEVCTRLGISRVTLWRKMRNFTVTQSNIT